LLLPHFVAKISAYHLFTYPRQIFKKLVNKNAIKPKIGGPPWQFFLKPMTPPPRDFGENFKYPHPPPPAGFSTRVHLCIQTTLQNELKNYNYQNSSQQEKTFNIILCLSEGI
jgi:hypothetical protein